MPQDFFQSKCYHLKRAHTPIARCQVSEGEEHWHGVKGMEGEATGDLRKCVKCSFEKKNTGAGKSEEIRVHSRYFKGYLMERGFEYYIE